jgi:hypothetical protein
MASPLRTCRSRPCGKALFQNLPGTGVWIPSGSLTIPLDKITPPRPAARDSGACCTRRASCVICRQDGWDHLLEFAFGLGVRWSVVQFGTQQPLATLPGADRCVAEAELHPPSSNLLADLRRIPIAMAELCGSTYERRKGPVSVGRFLAQRVALRTRRCPGRL